MNKITVSPVFREILATEYKGLRENSSYWLMLGYLMFNKFTDDETGKLIIPAEILAEIEGKQKEFVSKNYSGEDFLTSFSKDVQHIEWSGWDSRENKARIITKLVWGDYIAKTINSEREGAWKDTGRVFIENGMPFTKHKQHQYREMDRVDSLNRMKDAGCEGAKELLDYLNHLPPNLFYKILLNMPSAMEVARGLKKDAERQIDILNSVLDAYQPFYKPVESSVRIYPLNQNMLCLQREVRKALTKSWIEFDLKNAQLAIAARLWGVRTAQEFLATGQSFWTYLFEVVGIQKSEEAKRVLKTATYAIMYGAYKKRLLEILGSLEVEDAYERFINASIIKSLLRARRKQFKTILENKGAMDCFGNWLPIKDSPSRDKRSILAQLSQAYELKLLYPVIELARKYRDKNGFILVLWQHDGFSIQIHKPSSNQYWIDGIKFHVEENAKRLGILTGLECS